MNDINVKRPYAEAGRYLSFFLLGAGIGAAAGLMLAPEAGSDTRKKIGGWMKQKKDEGTQVLEEGKTIVSAAYQAGRQAYKEVEKKHALV